MSRRTTALALVAVTPSFAACGDSVDIETPWGALLALLVVGAAVLLFLRGRAPAFQFSRVSALRDLRPTFRSLLSRLPLVLRFVALTALVFAIMRPQVESFREDTVEGIDIMIVLDMSGSMEAVDMSQGQIQQFQRRHGEDPPSRFQTAIATLSRFVDLRERDRIGMVVFARRAYLQFPLTLDYSTIQGLLARLSLNTIDPSATAIGNALGLAIRGLMDSSAESKAVILITDGKQQGGNISPTQAAEIAAEEGIQMFPILVGSGGETMLPAGPGPHGLSFYRPEQYPIDAELLESIATTTDGTFYRAEQPEQLETGLNDILDRLERTQLRDVASVQEKELFGLVALAALIALSLEFLIALLLARRFP